MIGVGIDAVEVERFRSLVCRRPTIMQRVFTENELADLADRADPIPGLAARFAAKEAVMKALGVGIGTISFADIEVVRKSSGAPNISLTGRASEIAERLSARAWYLSMTHTALLASAVAIADDEPS